MSAVALISTLAILVIWFGYPLVVAGLAAFVGRRPKEIAPSEKRLSVIIATLDSAEVIRARVDDIMAAEYPGELIQVVIGLDQRGSVAPDSLGFTDPRVRAVAGDAPGGKAATLNAAVRAATGEILVFSDAAQRFAPGAIRRLVAALADPRLGAVSGALQIGRDGKTATLAERYWRFEKWLREREARVHSTVGVTGAVYAMRRECWHPLPAGLILDDVYAPMHLVLRGYRVGFEPGATAYDDRRFPPAQEYRRKARTLTGVVQLCIWLPEILVPWRNPIWAQFLFHKLLRLATPYLLLLAVFGAGGWLVLEAETTRPWLGGVVLAGIVAMCSAAVAAIPRLRQAAAMALAMQMAVVRATVNGLRGHWDVWSR